MLCELGCAAGGWAGAIGCGPIKGAPGVLSMVCGSVVGVGCMGGAAMVDLCGVTGLVDCVRGGVRGVAWAPKVHSSVHIADAPCVFVFF